MEPLKVVKWSEKFATGIRAVDSDHEGLFEDIRFLGEAIAANAGTKQIEHAIASLEAYCEEHFGREETFMISARYPDTHAHIREHRRMTGQIARLKELYRADPNQIDAQKVLTFLSHWLANHILGVDMQYVPYLHGDKMGQSKAPADSFREVSIMVPNDESKIVAGFVKIIESDHPVAKELAAAIAKFEERLEREEIESAKDLFCRT